MPETLIPLVVPGGELRGGRHLHHCQLALELLTAPRVRQRELVQLLIDELRAWQDLDRAMTRGT